MRAGRKENADTPAQMAQLARDIVSTTLLLRGLHTKTSSAEFDVLCEKKLEELRTMPQEKLESMKRSLQIYEKIIREDYRRGKKIEPVKEVPHL